MRKIEIIDDVRLRFPGRDEEFLTGIEVGSVSALLAHGNIPFRRELSRAAVDQLRPIAEHFRYGIVATKNSSGLMDVAFAPKYARPSLRIVR